MPGLSLGSTATSGAQGGQISTPVGASVGVPELILYAVLAVLAVYVIGKL